MHFKAGDTVRARPFRETEYTLNGGISEGEVYLVEGVDESWNPSGKPRVWLKGLLSSYYTDSFELVPGEEEDQDKALALGRARELLAVSADVGAATVTVPVHQGEPLMDFDLYRAVAAQLLDKRPSEVTDDERRLGKTLAAILGYCHGPNIAGSSGCAGTAHEQPQGHEDNGSALQKHSIEDIYPS